MTWRSFDSGGQQQDKPTSVHWYPWRVRCFNRLSAYLSISACIIVRLMPARLGLLKQLARGDLSRSLSSDRLAMQELLASQRISSGGDAHPRRAASSRSM